MWWCMWLYVVDKGWGMYMRHCSESGVGILWVGMLWGCCGEQKQGSKNRGAKNRGAPHQPRNACPLLPSPLHSYTVTHTNSHHPPPPPPPHTHTHELPTAQPSTRMHARSSQTTPILYFYYMHQTLPVETALLAAWQPMWEGGEDLRMWEGVQWCICGVQTTVSAAKHAYDQLLRTRTLYMSKCV